MTITYFEVRKTNPDRTHDVLKRTTSKRVAEQCCCVERARHKKRSGEARVIAVYPCKLDVDNDINVEGALDASAAEKLAAGPYMTFGAALLRSKDGRST